MKKSFFLMFAVYAAFFALGMPDGAFGVAWPGIRYDMGLPLERASILIITHSIFYSLAGWQTGRLASFFPLERLSFIGLGLTAAGMAGFSFVPGFAGLVGFTAVLGLGMGAVDSGVNAYTAKNLSVRHMNWLHCFWCMGGAVSPIIMSQMIIYYNWRAGYAAIFAVQSVVVVMLAASLLKGVWAVKEEAGPAPSSAATPSLPSPPAFLTARRYHVMQFAIFFLYVAFEYSITFWTASVLLESRGIGMEIIGLYPAVYLGSMMIGRAVTGFASRRVSAVNAIRIGFVTAVCGLIILTFSNNIAGMFMVGFGFAPVFPCLMNETKKRFDPAILSKLVGLQIASTGAGVILSAAAMGRILTLVSLEALFPVVIFCVVLAFFLNELIVRGMRK